MLTVGRAAGVAALCTGAVLVGAGPVVADNTPVAVMPGGKAWVATTVADSGAASKRPKAPSDLKRTCVQYKSDSAGGYATEAQFRSGSPATDGPGGWVVRRCSDGTLGTAWVARPSVSVVAEQLAQRATNRLPLPLPSPKFNPSRPSSAGPATLVAIPTWFWVDGWTPVRQRTQAGGVWAEVTATPVSATWFPGDGSPPVRCRVNAAWSAQAAPSSCEHTYVRSSAEQPANVYTARVVVTWQVTWHGTGGRSGSLPLMQRQATFPIAVAERQTVVTVGGER